ncbi:MAG: Excinuclease ABC C subunit domain protein [Parcubacteria group bacterium GW2011_GWF2_50_9]|nr:MAG: Excinuclease ABC C subunit domain protein [Parcubacteria group bacterium GW2011_GWF2_50_9]
MKSQDVQKYMLPDAPGVYFFMLRKKILYIGKAASLRLRVRSYFNKDVADARGPWVASMVAKANRLSFKRTGSILEALLLEAELIKKHSPPYNSDGKDDKSYNCVVITDEPFPRVLVARRRELDSGLKANSYKLKAIYGPFPHDSQLRTAMKIIRKIFPFRDGKCVPCQFQRDSASNLRPSAGCRPCFNRQLGLCPGVCTGDISEKEYARTVRNLRLFLKGRRSRLLKLLLKEMNAAAKREEFEKAGELKRQLLSLRHIQDVALIQRDIASALVSRFSRIEAYDISHFGGKNVVGAMTVVEGGVAQKSEYRLFKIRGEKRAHEVKGLMELLRRRWGHPEWRSPDLVVVDGNDVQRKAAQNALYALNVSIPIVAVVKDEKHRPRELLGDSSVCSKYRDEILLANSEAHRFSLKFQRNQRRMSIF